MVVVEDMEIHLDTTTGNPLWSVDFSICCSSATDVESYKMSIQSFLQDYFTTN